MPGSTQKTVASKASRSVRRAPPVRGLVHRAALAERATPVRLVQPSLKVGAANDPLEREAETMAERVVAMPVPQFAAPDAGSQPSAAAGDARRAAEDQPNTDTLETDPPVPEDHVDPEVPPAEDVDNEALSAADMDEIETGQPVDTGGDEPLPETPAPPGQGALPDGADAAMPARDDAAVVGAEGGPAPADVARRVAEPGAGRPLPGAVRDFLEPRFGRDFSKVRVHDAPDDRRAANRIGARAFTHRDHVWIGPGESASDRKLMAHELTHVVQQTAPGPAKAATRAVADAEPKLRRGYIRNKAEKYARNVPGYRLICLIIGKSPITGDTVERNATNVLGAMMSLIPGGNFLFERLEESRVLEEAFEWVWTRLLQLNITWTRIKGLISDLIDYLPDWPSDVIDYAIKLFKPLVDDIKTFVKDVLKKILEFIVRGALKLAGSWGEKVWEIIQAAGAVLMTILEDPLGFAKNLFSAVVKGFRQFGSNIWDHIKSGLLAWLFGTLQGLELEMPERLDFKGLISIGLQIVGLTYANFRAIMVKKLGSNGERKMTFIEKSVDAVRLLLKEGFVGMWQRVFQMIDNFRETVLGGIRDFVIKQLIMGGIGWLAGLSNPVGAVVKIVLSIYNLIVTFLERLDQILEVARSIFSSIGAIAAGRIQEAADFVERTMAKTIPVVISFLAALVPVTGIVNSIRSIIKKLQGAVTGAIDKLVSFVAKKAKKLFSRIIAKINNKRKLPSANFKVGVAQHRIYAKKKGKKVDVMIASGEGHEVKDVAKASAAEAKNFKGEEAKKIGSGISNETSEANTETAQKKNVDLDSQNQNQVAKVTALKDELVEAGTEIEAIAAPATQNDEVDETQGYDGPLFRFREPRDAAVEGQTGTHATLSETVAAATKKDERSAGSFYEIDHVIEKQIPKAILENLAKLAPGSGKADKDVREGIAYYRTSDRNKKVAMTTVAEQQDKGAHPFGEIGGKKYPRIPEMAPDFPSIILYRPNHRAGDTVKPKDVEGWINDAAKSDDPVTTLAAHLRAQLDTEKANIVKAYQQDKSAPEDVGKAINAGLTRLEDLNAPIYGLASAATPLQDATQKAPDAKETSAVTFSPTASAPNKPDFARIEGTYQAHGLQPAGFGDYLEGDHVFEASFGEKARNLTLGQTPMWDKVKDIRPDDDKWVKTKEARQKRLDLLQGADVFPASSPVHSYTEKEGKSILILRPIHRAVTAGSRAARSVADLMPPALPDANEDAVKDFLASKDDRDLDRLRSPFASAIGKVVQQRTEEHIAKIQAEYEKEPANVQKANAGVGQPNRKPSAEELAANAMKMIVQRTKMKLDEARQETRRVFPG